MVEGLQTADALSLARLNPMDFQAAHARGLVPWLPPTVNGVARVYETDDLIAAFCLGRCHEHLITPRYAYQIATDIHRLVSHDHTIQKLTAWRVTGRDGKPLVVVGERAPSAKAIELLWFDIANIRMLILQGKREMLRKRSK